MLKRIKDNKGQDMYTLTIVNTNDLTSPRVEIISWDGAMKEMDKLTTECDNENSLCKLISKNVYKELRADAYILKNYKGWGGDFFVLISVEPAYMED